VLLAFTRITRLALGSLSYSAGLRRVFCDPRLNRIPEDLRANGFKPMRNLYRATRLDLPQRRDQLRVPMGFQA
jgi:hypothetical protein